MGAQRNRQRFKRYQPLNSIEHTVHIFLQQKGIQPKAHELSGFMSCVKDKAWHNYQEECLQREQRVEDVIRELKISMPNARSGESYRHEVEVPKPSEITRLSFSVDAPGLEVSYSQGILCIEGVPRGKGTYKLTMTYSYEAVGGNLQISSVAYDFDVLASPRDLWKDIPTPTDIQYYKPDRETKYEFGVKRMVAASQRGRSHAHEAKPRDDHFSIAFDEASGWHILAVADGAGSASYSREGSRIACETVADFCLKKLRGRTNSFEQCMTAWGEKQESRDLKAEAHKEAYNLLGQATFTAFKNIEEEANAQNRTIKQYATTLLLSVCKKTTHGWFVASFWVGDGAIGLYYQEEQTLHLMGAPDGGEYAGQTRFLTSSEIFVDAIYRIRIDIVDEFTALILMSDGITDPKFETDANLQNITYWHSLWEGLNTELRLSDDAEVQYQLLKWMDFWSIGNHDDRTLAMIY